MTHVKKVIKEGLKRPDEVPGHIFNQFTRLSRSRRVHPALIELVGEAFDRDYEEVESYYRELTGKNQLVRETTDLGNIIGHRALPGYTVLCYLSCRVVKPDRVVETGVHLGKSSAAILQAMEDNGKGNLHSIDFPGTDENPVVDKSLPGGEIKYELEDVTEVGKRVPDDLTDRWSLHFGKSREILEEVMEENGPVDVFFHDSEHSYENMMFEFKAAMEKLAYPGYIISDDINWSAAFETFARDSPEASHTLSKHCDTESKYISDLGIALKNSIKD